MGLRLEFVLSAMIIAIVVAMLFLKVNPSTGKTDSLKKELEFTNTTFTEVTTRKLAGHLYAAYGVRYQGVLSLRNIIYTSETIKRLVADRGTYKESILYLYGHVLLEEAGGYTYTTQQANYNQQTEMLYITAPFRGIRDKNIISGKYLVYDTRHKKMIATKVDSVLYTTEK